MGDRIKTEFEFEIKNLANLIDSKDRKIAQLERECKSSEQAVSQKTTALQEQLHTQQETSLKCKSEQYGTYIAHNAIYRL